MSCSCCVPELIKNNPSFQLTHYDTMSSVTCARKVALARLLMQSVLIVPAVMFLTVETATRGEKDAVVFSTEPNAEKTVNSLLWLYSYVLLPQTLVGWMAITSQRVILLLAFEILTGLLVFMHTVLILVGLATDEVTILLTMLIALSIEVPTFLSALYMLSGAKRTPKGAVDWDSFFTPNSPIDGTRRATIA